MKHGIGSLDRGDILCKGLDAQETSACGPEGVQARGCCSNPHGTNSERLFLPTVEEGPVFAICVAGAHDQATLARWIQGLQETNPGLAQIPVVFRLAGSTGELLATSSGLEEPPPPPPEGQEEEENNQQRQQQGQS